MAAYERRSRSVSPNVVAGAFSFTERRPFEILDAAAAHAVRVAW